MENSRGEKYPVVSNAEVYGLEKAVKSSKYPFAKNAEDVNGEVTKTVKNLASAPIGSGHDNFLKGIIVQFDLSLTKQAWSELQRYHFIDFVSSQSAMHCIMKFNLREQYIEWVDERIIDLVRVLVSNYEEDPCDENFYPLIYSSPAGLILTAGMTTNYQQLKTIYAQRRTHRLPEWQEFCDWIETLPYSEWITGKEPQGLKKVVDYLTAKGIEFDSVSEDGELSFVEIYDFTGAITISEDVWDRSKLFVCFPEEGSSSKTPDEIIQMLRTCFEKY